MKVTRIVDAVYINGVEAKIGDIVKPYDMIDARQGVVAFEGGVQLAHISTRLVDAVDLSNVPTIKEAKEEVKPQVTDAVTEAKPTAKTK